MTSPTATTKHSLRVLAKRYAAFEAQLREHGMTLDDLTWSHTPTLREGVGITTDTEAFIVFGEDAKLTN